MKTHIQTLATAVLFVFLLLPGKLVFGQEVKNGTETYKGLVVDAKTEKPIVFASISAQGSNTSTVSNNEGRFTLKIKTGATPAAIEVAHLGYTTLRVETLALKEAENVIRLQPAIIPLKEVVVHGYNPAELFDEVMRRIKNNYNVDADMMKGFYREAIRKRSNYIYISESIVDIYKAGYTNALEDDQVKIFKGRISSKVKALDTIIVKLQGGPTIPLLMDIAKNPALIFNDDNVGKYDFKMGEMSAIDDRAIYVLEFQPKDKAHYSLYGGKLFIDAQTLAIAAAEFSLNIENIEDATRLFIRSKPAHLRFEPLSTYYFVKYKEDKGKYYFNYARFELNFTCDYKKKLFKSKYAVMAELAITDKDNQNVHKFPFRDRVAQTKIFADSQTAFTDPDFWGDQNFIEPDKSIEEALVKYAKWLKKTGHE